MRRRRRLAAAQREGGFGLTHPPFGTGLRGVEIGSNFKDILTVTPPLAPLKLCRIKLSVVYVVWVQTYPTRDSRGARRDASVRRDNLKSPTMVQSRAAWTTGGPCRVRSLGVRWAGGGWVSKI